MANTLLTPQVIANAAIATLYDEAIFGQLVHRDYSNEFVGAVGDSVTIRKPAVFEAQDFAGSITTQNATEGSETVTLDKHKDVSFAVTSRDLTHEIEDFQEQFLVPAMQALIQAIEVDLFSLRADVTQKVGVDGASFNDPRVLAEAAAVLTKNRVPLQERLAIVGPDTYANYIVKPPFDKADSAGSTSALREASLGRAYSFDTYQSAYADAVGTDLTETSLAFHKSAFTLVTRPLALPKGASSAAIANFRGFGIRVVMDYDVQTKSDVVSLDVLYGVKTLSPERAVIINGDA